MVMRKSENQLGFIWTSYTSEFSTEVWLCVAVAFVMGSCLYAFIVTYSPSETVRASLGECAMIVIGAITAQSKT